MEPAIDFTSQSDLTNPSTISIRLHHSPIPGHFPISNPASCATCVYAYKHTSASVIPHSTRNPLELSFNRASTTSSAFSPCRLFVAICARRSEEHTSELQSHHD